MTTLSGPLFPSLTPRAVDPLWFSIDGSSDDESELAKLEEEYQTWVSIMDTPVFVINLNF